MNSIKKAVQKAQEEKEQLNLIKVSNKFIQQDAKETKEKDLPRERWEGDSLKYTKTRCISVSPRSLLKNRVYTAQNEYKPAGEFTILRTKVLQTLRQKCWNTVFVTGFAPSEGKSIIAANLAVSISKDVRQTTLLVDLNFNKPSVHRIFGLGLKEPGLKDYFQGKERLENIFLNPGINQFTMLLTGGHIANSSELLGSPEMEKLVQELKDRYRDRIIVFDTPAINDCPNSLIFSNYVDSILLVARAAITTKDNITSAMKLLPKDKLLGFVFNEA